MKASPGLAMSRTRKYLVVCLGKEGISSNVFHDVTKMGYYGSEHEIRLTLFLRGHWHLAESIGWHLAELSKIAHGRQLFMAMALGRIPQISRYVLWPTNMEEH